MNTRRSPFILVLVVLLSCLFWVLTNLGNDEESYSRDEVSRVEDASVQLSRSAPSSDAESQPITREDVPGSQPHENSLDTPSLPRDGEAWLEVLVVKKTTKEPVGGAALTLWPTSLEASKINLFLDWMEARGWGEKTDRNGSLGFVRQYEGDPPAGPLSLTTDESGKALLGLPSSVAFQVSVALSASDQNIAQVQAEPLQPGERRRVVFELDTNPDLPFFGKVLDGPTGDPLPGASVTRVANSVLRLDGLLLGGPLEVIGTGRPPAVTTTNESGIFYVEGESRRNPFVLVQYGGRGPSIVMLDRNHATQETAAVVTLWPSASVSGHVRIGSVPVQGAALTFRTSLRSLTYDGSLTYGNAPTWRTRSDSEGFYELSDLPAGVHFQITFQASGTDPVAYPDALTLKRGESRTIDFDLGSCIPIIGQVIDQNGEPVPDVRVVAIRPQFYVYGVADSEPVYMRSDREAMAGQATTDSLGRFRIPSVSLGRWQVGVLLEDEAQKRVTENGTLITVDGSTNEVETVLKVWRGLYIRGLVVGPDGEQVKASGVTAMSEQIPGFLHSWCEEDGSFSVGPLLPGHYKVTALSGPPGVNPYADSDTVMIQAGREDLVLHLRHAGRLSGNTLLRTTNQPASAQLFISGADGQFATVSESNPRGEFLVVGLPPGQYDVFAHSDAGMVGMATGIAVLGDALTGEVLIDLSEGATLVLRYCGDDPSAWATLTVNRARIWAEGLDRDVPRRVFVPPGRIRLEVFPRGSTASIVHDVDLVSGQIATLAIECNE